MKLSGIVISKNSEDQLADALDSLRFCDEVVYVDDHSVDRSAEIAERFGARVVKNPNKSEGYVEAVRKFAINQAKGEWVLLIDADERITKELGEEIKVKISKESSTVAYNIIRQNFYLGNNPWPAKDKVERLFKKEVVKDWDWKLHTSPEVKGNVEDLNGLMLHYTHQNLTSMLSKTIEWSKVEAQVRFNSGHPKMTWWRFPRVMVTAFFDYYVKQEGWRIGTAGLVESMYQAFSMFITYARLWELQNNTKRTN